MNLDLFDFNLPEELIAQTPLAIRDESRLLVLSRSSGKIKHGFFKEIVDYLNPGDALVLNNTRVLPARLFGLKKGTGANIEVLLLKQLDNDRWETLVKPGKRCRVNDEIIFGDGLLNGIVEEVTEAGGRIIRFQYKGLFNEILDRLGNMPLPPYIKVQLKDKERYQTVYAKEVGSSAAPTAGLHFTDKLLEDIRNKGINIIYITLHVGLGTFRPVSVDNIKDHKMHSEFYFFSKEASDKLNDVRRNNNKIVAVGTTTVRTLETVYNKEINSFIEESGWTDIFIYPGYKFNAIDSMITNFHLPKSSLIMLVSALAGRENIINAYQEAIEKAYRFYSFGDVMLIE